MSAFEGKADIGHHKKALLLVVVVTPERPVHRSNRDDVIANLNFYRTPPIKTCSLQYGGVSE